MKLTDSQFIKPVTNLRDLGKHLILGRTEFERALIDSYYKIKDNVYTSRRREGVNDPRPNKYVDFSLYDNEARIHLQNQHIGVNIDLMA
jgi:hypothetical protein